MRLADTCHPKWGYLAPAPNFMKTARIFIVAAAIGVTASGAVFCSSFYRPVEEASVAERTLVSAENPRVGTDKTTDASQARLRSENCSLVEPRRVEYAGALSPAGGASCTHARSNRSDRAGAEGPALGEHASAATSLAESPRIKPPENPAVGAAESERASAFAGSETESAAVRRAPVTKTRPVVRTAPRYRLYATTRYQQWYAERERGFYGLQSGYGSYKYRDYK